MAPLTESIPVADALVESYQLQLQLCIVEAPTCFSIRDHAGLIDGTVQHMQPDVTI
jgi:hypothetical protein